MVQWEKAAREYILNELNEYGEEIKSYVYLTLEQINAKREEYGLKPLNRITKEIVKESVLNISLDSIIGDAQRNKIDYNFVDGYA